MTVQEHKDAAEGQAPKSRVRRLWEGLARSVRFSRGHLDLDPLEDLNRAQRILVRNLRVMFLVFRLEVYKRVELHAQALTMKSLLALIPTVVVVVALSSKIGLGLDTINQQSIAWMIKALSGTEELSDTLGTLLRPENFEVARLGPATIIILSLTVISLLSHVETAFNALFYVPSARSVGVRLLTYWAILTVGPLLLGLSLAFTLGKSSGPVQEFLASGGAITQFFTDALPLLLTWTGFAILFKGVPNTRVRLGPAILAAMVSGTLWNLAKVAFAAYARSNVTVRDLYGSLATFPMFILWLYISWVLTLVGVRLCYAFHHASTYRAGESEESASFASEVAAFLRVFWQVAWDAHHGLPSTDVQRLPAQTGFPPSLIESAQRHLLAGGFVTTSDEQELRPAKDLSTLTFHDLLCYLYHRAGKSYHPRHDTSRIALEPVLASIDPAKHDVSQTTIADAIATSSQEARQTID